MADLARLVDLWWQAAQEVTALARELPDDAWDQPTDLAGWNVHDQVAHLAHLEAILAGAPDETVEIGQPEHVKSLLGTYTEQGVVARRDRTPAELIDELAEVTDRRRASLAESLPAPGDPAPGAFGLLGWDTARLFRNRPLDLWMHQQDIRRAVGRPGGMDSPVAQHVADYLLESVGFIVGKKTGAPVGTTVRVEVAGSDPVTVQVGEDGRARPTQSADADVTIAMDREAWIILAGGRRTPEQVDGVTVTGDTGLGAAILANLAVTP